MASQKIVRAATDKQFLDVVERLECSEEYRPEKLWSEKAGMMFRLTQYNPKPTITVQHTLDLDSLYYLAQKVCSGQFSIDGEVPAEEIPGSYATKDVLKRLEKLPGCSDIDPENPNRRKINQAGWDMLTTLGKPKGSFSEMNQETLGMLVEKLDARLGVKEEKAPVGVVLTAKGPNDITRYRDYKGGRSDKYPTGFEARVFEVVKQPSRRGEGYIYLISITNGPGETAGAGHAVKLVGGEGTRKAIFPITEKDFIGMMSVTTAYINAWMAANFALINRVNDVANNSWREEKPQYGVAATVPSLEPDYNNTEVPDIDLPDIYIPEDLV